MITLHASPSSNKRRKRRENIGKGNRLPPTNLLKKKKRISGPEVKTDTNPPPNLGREGW